MNPSDGQLYIAGFQILGWGTTATRLAGLGRVRYTGAPVTAPRQVTPMREGVLLRFDVENAEVWLNESNLLAGVKMLFGIDPKKDYEDKVGEVDLR